MSTDIAVRGGSDLAIEPTQTFFTEKQVAALRQLGVDRANNADLAVFFHQSVRTGLDPFARQIYMIERQGKQTIQTGIDGFRLVARRATDRVHGTFGYEDTLWCGADGAWHDVWLSRDAPAAAKVTVVRDGQRYPAIALHSEYVALKRDGEPNSMWASKPALMLAKCAEALALRKAFPQDLSGLYTSDEMGQAARADDGPEPAARQSGRSGVSRLRAAVPAKDEVDAAFETPPVDVTTLPEAETVQDAEVVEDPRPADPDAVTKSQLTKIAAGMRDLKITDRNHALTYVAGVIGREVGSRNELTKGEAHQVIEALEFDLQQPASDGAA